MIDFHCHLDLYADPRSVVKECIVRRLYVLSVTTTPSAWNQTAALSSGYERIRTALGLHPELAAQRKHELVLFDRLLPNSKYVGEIGLDGSPQFRDGWDDQVSVFEHILSSCRVAGGRIMSIHSRRAASAVLDRLRQEPGAGVPVLHWYSGSNRDLDRAIDLGCWFSVNPSMMFGAKGRELVRRMPPERILTETDGPFAIMNGQSALPWDVDVVVSQLAEVWRLPRAQAEIRLGSNFRELMGGT
jgi:TatD DNase family protein